MKKRAVHSVSGLAVVRDGRWVQFDDPAFNGQSVDSSGGLFGVIELVFSHCGWLRKNGK
jgi:hypothetical protein